MRPIMLVIVIAAFAVALAIHAAFLAGVPWDARPFVWAGIVGGVLVSVPAALVTGNDRSKRSPQAAKRLKVIWAVVTVLMLYVAVLMWAGMTSDELSTLKSEGKVSLWDGQRPISSAKARAFTAFPMPFLALVGLLLLDRMKRDRELLEP